jgi:hypothetical protein
MEIRIFGMTVRLEIIIITLIVGMIMGAHTLCACAKVPVSEAFSLATGMGKMEGMEGQAEAPASGTAPDATGNDSVDASGEAVSQSGSSTPPPAPANVPPVGGSAKKGAEKISAESVAGMNNILPKALSGFQNILSSVTSAAGAMQPPSKDTKDAFSDYSEYRQGDNNSDVASSWINKASIYSKNLGYQDATKKSNAYSGTQVPLPEGELFFFQNNQFKPECCPSPYSASTGCACMSSEQVAYLNSRGGNRTSDSEY